MDFLLILLFTLSSFERLSTSSAFMIGLIYFFFRGFSDINCLFSCVEKG